MTSANTLSAPSRDFLRELVRTGGGITCVFDFKAVGERIGITDGVTTKAVRELNYAKLIAYVHEPGEGVLTHAGSDLGFKLRKQAWNHRRRKQLFGTLAKAGAIALGAIAVGYLFYALGWI